MLVRSPVISRLYRTLVPQSARARLRRRVKHQANRVPYNPAGPRVFDMPLPVTTRRPRWLGGQRRTLLVDVPRDLYLGGIYERAGAVGHEPEVIAALLGLVETVKPKVVFDIGANIGPRALLVPALLGVPVVAFEPAPATASALRHLVTRNGLACTVEEAALGAEAREAVLHLSPTDTSTSLNADWREDTGHVTVPVWTLDDYCAQTGQTPGVLKLDTETTEPDVLRGATRVLATRPWIVCEAVPGRTEAALEELLLPLGYACFHIDGAVPLVRHVGLQGQTTREHLNWLFAPAEPGPELWAAILRWRQAVSRTPARLGDPRPRRS